MYIFQRRCREIARLYAISVTCSIVSCLVTLIKPPRTWLTIERARRYRITDKICIYIYQLFLQDLYLHSWFLQFNLPSSCINFLPLIHRNTILLISVSINISIDKENLYVSPRHRYFNDASWKSKREKSVLRADPKAKRGRFNPGDISRIPTH